MRILITGGSGFIGTNLCEHFYNKHIIYKNVDIAVPKIDRQKDKWENIDVLNYEKLQKVMLKFEPGLVINLAAQTNTALTDKHSHNVNFLSIKNIADVITAHNLNSKLIHFSSMLVNDLGTPKSELDQMNATTWYGCMKAKAEKKLQSSENIDFCILRPTSIFGPHMDAPYYELFNLSIRQLPVPYPREMGIRPFGFVGNVVKQVDEVVCNFTKYNGGTFYLMDNSDLNVKIISAKIRKHLGLRAPMSLHNLVFKCLGFCGDFLKKMGIRFPLTSARYRNLITSQSIPDYRNIRISEDQKISIDEGIVATINWMEDIKKRV